MGRVGLGGNALATLGPAPAQHEAATARRHPLAEAVATGTLGEARLECPLHGSLPLGCSQDSTAPNVSDRPPECQGKQGVIHSAAGPFLSGRARPCGGRKFSRGLTSSTATARRAR